MPNVHVIEMQIPDHPEYETFVAVRATYEEARKEVTRRLQEEIDDWGDGEGSIIVKPLTEEHTRFENTIGSVFWITRYEV